MPENCGVMYQFFHSGSRVPDAWYVKLILSLTVTFYLTNTENRSKKSRTQLPYYCFE